jgi:hypothetical protein
VAVVRAEVELGGPLLAAARSLDDCNLAAIMTRDQLGQRGVWLYRHRSAAELEKHLGNMADIRTDVEDEVAAADEWSIELASLPSGASLRSVQDRLIGVARDLVGGFHRRTQPHCTRPMLRPHLALGHRLGRVGPRAAGLAGLWQRSRLAPTLCWDRGAGPSRSRNARTRRGIVNLYHVFQVLGRHRGLVVVGLLVAVAVAIFTYARPSWDGGPKLTTRVASTWGAQTSMFLTESGSPELRAVPSYRPSNPKTGAPATPAGDQQRFSNLAVLYAELAASDEVRRAAEQGGRRPLPGKITVDPVTFQTGEFSYPQVLPMIRISATAPTPAAAAQSVERIRAAFQQYVKVRQGAAGIKPEDRVLVKEVRAQEPPKLIESPSKALPAVMFLALSTLILIAVFGIDNLHRTQLESMRAQDIDPSLDDHIVVEPGIDERVALGADVRHLDVGSAEQGGTAAKRGSSQAYSRRWQQSRRGRTSG